MGVRLLGATLGMLASASHAQDIGLLELGVRAGFEAVAAAENFRQYDVFAVYELPARPPQFQGWRLRSRLNVTAGALHGGNETGFIGTFGPGVGLRPIDSRWRFDAGVGFALVSRHTFDRQDFGAPFQFVAHGGIGYRVTPELEIAYRIHHMSDAGIFGGQDLNQHMLELSWGFGPHSNGRLDTVRGADAGGGAGAKLR